MQTIIITDLRTKANFHNYEGGGGVLSFNQLLTVLSKLSDKQTKSCQCNKIKFIKRLK